MKNPVRFSNRKDKNIFIYCYYDNSLLQLAELLPDETTILNIPVKSHLIIKSGKYVGNYIIPNETIIETYLNSNYFIL